MDNSQQAISDAEDFEKNQDCYTVDEAKKIRQALFDNAATINPWDIKYINTFLLEPLDSAIGDSLGRL